MVLSGPCLTWSPSSTSYLPYLCLPYLSEVKFMYLGFLLGQLSKSCLQRPHATLFIHFLLILVPPKCIFPLPSPSSLPLHLFPMIILVIIYLSICFLPIPFHFSPLVLPPYPSSIPASLPSVVVAGAGVWGEGGDYGRWLHSE